MKTTTSHSTSDYRNLIDIPPGVKVWVYLPDGVRVLLPSADAAFQYLQRAQGQSVAYALKHGGWKVEAYQEIV